MALYSRSDYYVKTFTARNCSLKSKFRAFRQLKQNVCPLHPRPCLPKSLISVWLDGRAGSALARCPVFSCPVLSCRYPPLQPTPTGAFEKVRFAIRMCTTREVRGMHGFLWADAGMLRVSRSEAVRGREGRARTVLCGGTEAGLAGAGLTGVARVQARFARVACSRAA
jgi:hypothetical protein